MNEEQQAEAVKAIAEIQDLLSKYKDIMKPEDKAHLEEVAESLRSLAREL